MRMLLLACIATTLLAPAASSQATRTYTSPDGAYSFSLPGNFPVFTNPTRFEPNSYLAVCPQNAQVCVSYRKARLRKTNFNAAAFSVTVLSPGSSEETCNASPQRNVPPQPDVRIGGVAFHHFTTGDAAMSHSLTSQIYRSFRGGRCYQLQTSIMKTSFGVYPPGTKQEFTATAERAVEKRLGNVVRSFRFQR
ncbi:MAG: hypothetical protein ABI383_05520 [Acidobacteriaceae bacterium]